MMGVAVRLSTPSIRRLALSSAVADTKAPRAVVQADQPLSSYRSFPLDTQSQPDGWLTRAFSGMLHSPSGFPFG